MGELATIGDSRVITTAPSSTDSLHSSPSSSLLPNVSSTFLYNSMMSATHVGSPQPSCLTHEDVDDDDEDDDDDDDFSSSFRTGESRKAREFIPESKKDEKYWERRRKNNEAAKRSREKRRQNDALMEQEIAELKQQNATLLRENTTLLREVAALKAIHGEVTGSVTPNQQPPPPPQTSTALPAALGPLDLLALQRLLSALASNNGDRLLDPVQSRGVGNVEESPLDLSGGKPSPMYPYQPMLTNDVGKLTELAVLTTTPPPAGCESIQGLGSWHTQPYSFTTTPVPITPTIISTPKCCSGIQTLISAVALTKTTSPPLLGDNQSTTVFSWDVGHKTSPRLPLGLQPPPLKPNDTSNAPTKRRSGTVRSSPDQFDDERYRERRRRNNEAVRRCRENKRARLSMCDDVTGRLQSDNTILRSKLDGLNSEVRALRHLLAGQITPAQMVTSQPSNETLKNTEDSRKSSQDDIPEKPLSDSPVESSPTKLTLKYALPKKGIPRVPPHGQQLSHLKQHLAFNLAGSSNVLMESGRVVAN